MKGDAEITAREFRNEWRQVNHGEVCRQECLQYATRLSQRFTKLRIGQICRAGNVFASLETDLPSLRRPKPPTIWSCQRWPNLHARNALRHCGRIRRYDHFDDAVRSHHGRRFKHPRICCFHSVTWFECASSGRAIWAASCCRQ